MKRKTILTILVALLVIGMLVAVADPVVAESHQAVEILNIEYVNGTHTQGSN